MSDSNQSFALFLMHNFNDIDHMTPVIDTLMASGDWKCTIVFYPAATFGSVKFETDWRLLYLEEQHGVPAYRIEDVAPSSKVTLRLFGVRQWIQKLCKGTPFLGRLFGRDVRGLLPWFLVEKLYDHFLSIWMRYLSATGRELMERFTPDVVVIDWGKTHNIITPLLERARKNKIPVIQLPHGAWTYEGVYSHSSQFDIAKLAKKTRVPETQADIVVVDNLYKGYRTEIQGVPRNRMRFLGLARFTPQWLQRLSTLPAGSAKLASGAKPKLVWFPTWLMACNLEGVDQTLAVLEEFADKIDIVLKVHTRNPENSASDYGLRLPAESRIRIVANEEESFAITRWADIVVITQSSIVYDAFLLDKPVLYLKYTHDFECMWENDNVGETVTSPDGLRAILNTVVSGQYETSYDKSAVARYMKLGVTAGKNPDMVLSTYIDLFHQAVAGEPLTIGYSFEETCDQWQQASRNVTSIEAPKGAL